MAGEIQLNSTTLATESSGTVTLSNVNSATNRTNLGLGSIATQASDSISISGGNITGGTLGSSVVFPAGHIIQVVTPSVSVEANSLTTSYVNYYEVSITLKSSSSNVLILHTFEAYNASSSGFGQNIYRSTTSPVTTSDTVVFDHTNEDSTGPLGWYSGSGVEFLTTTTHAVDSITGQSSGDTLYYGFFYKKHGGTVDVPSNNSQSNGFFATTLFEIQK